jgi:hypothetical protein
LRPTYSMTLLLRIRNAFGILRAIAFGPEIDHQLELGRILDGQVTGKVSPAYVAGVLCLAGMFFKPAEHHAGFEVKRTPPLADSDDCPTNEGGCTMGTQTVAEVVVETLQDALRQCLAQPGPALLDAVTDPMELIMPAHIEAKEVFGMTLYSAKAILSGRAGDMLELVTHL